MVTKAATGLRKVRGPGLLLLGATLLPAVITTLLTWLFYPQWWQLSAFFWYSIPSNSFIPIPHEPGVIVAGAIYAPALVAVVGGLATTVASTVDHTLVTRALRVKSAAPIKESRALNLAVRLFSWQPWWTIFIFAVTPIPFYPIRVVAPAANYPLFGYVSAVMAGRVPRYFLLATGGAWARSLTLPYFS